MHVVTVGGGPNDEGGMALMYSVRLTMASMPYICRFLSPSVTMRYYDTPRLGVSPRAQRLPDVKRSHNKATGVLVSAFCFCMNIKY